MPAKHTSEGARPEEGEPMALLAGDAAADGTRNHMLLRTEQGQVKKGLPSKSFIYRAMSPWLERLSHYFDPTTMSQERSAFQTEVAQVELWWKVSEQCSRLGPFDLSRCRTPDSPESSDPTLPRRSFRRGERFPSSTLLTFKRRSCGLCSLTMPRRGHRRTLMARKWRVSQCARRF